MAIEVKDVENALHLEHEHGKRFRGWYFFKNFIEKKSIPLNYKDTDLNYLFNIYEYKYNFIIPSKIEFSEGMIAYTLPERMLGIFRFPRNEQGKFVAPFPVINVERKLMDLSEDKLKELLRAQQPLVFEAFRIPIYSFTLFDLNDFNMKEISEITDLDFIASVKKEHEHVINQMIEEIKSKILSLPNYLLILENVLNRQWKNLGELATATGGIIHI